MKQILTLFAVIFFSTLLHSQVGINNTNPKASLDITASNQANPSNTDGLLIPRIDDFPATNPAAAQNGMMVYLTTTSGSNAPGFYYWNNGSSTWLSAIGGTVQKLDDLSDGKSDSDGSSVFLGVDAGANDDSSNRNVAIGFQALYSVVFGSNHTANGYQALYSNTSGSDNTANGYRSLYSNTSGSNNTANGHMSQYFNTTGHSNTSYGASSLIDNVSGDYNTALGYRAGHDNLGSSNVFLGSNAGSLEMGSGKLYIENSAANRNNALVYGDFFSNILRVNGEFQIGVPTGTGYAFPTTDGTANQLLKTDGSGQLGFINDSSLGTDDQNISGSALSGTSLTIGIENGTSQVIDLSSLQNENTLDQAYDEGGTGNGRTITADSGAVNITGADGFQVTGTFGSGTTNLLSGGGTRLFFNPRKAAFRAGYVPASQWNDANLGAYSFASGHSTTASGNTSFASGYGSIASAPNSTAMGYYTTASGIDATALGGHTTASNTFSTAIGSNTIASGNASTAMGSNSTASGLYSTATGSFTTASGDKSITSGNNTTASGIASTAMGSYTNASGLYSTAMGHYATSPSYAETTLGVFSTTYSPFNSTSFNNSDRLFSIGNGVDTANRSNALTIYKNGLMNINDAYNMPLTDGTANQIMATNGAGQLAFINGSSLQDADWYESGGTPPNSINDNIYTNGKVGINNPAPSGYLDIKANSTSSTGQIELTETVSGDGARIMFQNAVETTNKWTLYGRADNTNADGYFNIHHTSSGNVITVRGNGKVGIKRTPTTNTFEVGGNASKTTAGSWLANSDRRLKTDIKIIEGKTALDKIMKMKGITYLWNDNKTGIKRPTEIQYGFIAQDLMQVFPEKVSKDALGYYQTAYGDYDPIFVEGIKELKKEVEILSQENKNLKQQLSKYEQLEARLTALENKTNLSTTNLVVIEE